MQQAYSSYPSTPQGWNSTPGLHSSKANCLSPAAAAVALHGQRAQAGCGSREGASLRSRMCRLLRQQTRWGRLKRAVVLVPHLRAGAGQVRGVGLLWVLILQLLAAVIDYIVGADGSGCDGGG